MRRGAILLGFSFLISKLLGLLRDNLLASMFGAGAHLTGAFNLDTYYAAFRLPDLIFNLLSYGVLSAAFVPLFVEIMKKDHREAALRFANEVMTTVGIAIAIISVGLMIAAPLMVRLLVPGFAPEDFATTVMLTRLMLVTPLFFTIGSILGGVQNSLNKFLGLSLAPVVYNAGIVLGILILGKSYGVYGVTIGVMGGAVLHMLVQIPGAFTAGIRYRWPGSLWNARIKEMFVLSLPRIFGMSVTQISLLIDTLIASTLAAGSITIINFASNIEALPMGLIAISISIVSFGTLAAYVAEKKIDAFVKTVRENIERVFFLLIPITAGMWLLRFHLVKLLLGYGKFSVADSTQTANTMGIFLAGLACGGIVFILARAFYALKNTKTPVTVGLIAVAANIIGTLVFTKVLNLATYGLALSNSIADAINALLLFILLRKKLQTSILNMKELGKFIFSALVMSVLVYGITLLPLPFVIQIVIAVVGGAVVYFGVSWLLGCRQLRAVIHPISGASVVPQKENPRQ